MKKNAVAVWPQQPHWTRGAFSFARVFGRSSQHFPPAFFAVWRRPTGSVIPTKKRFGLELGDTDVRDDLWPLFNINLQPAACVGLTAFRCLPQLPHYCCLCREQVMVLKFHKKEESLKVWKYLIFSRHSTGVLRKTCIAGLETFCITSLFSGGWRIDGCRIRIYTNMSDDMTHVKMFHMKRGKTQIRETFLPVELRQEQPARSSRTKSGNIPAACRSGSLTRSKKRSCVSLTGSREQWGWARKWRW